MNSRESYSLTYVASGCSYIRLTFPEVKESEDLQNTLNIYLKKMNSAFDKHKFSLLYNGFTEPRFGETFMKLRKNANFIEADSGGLQIITQGKKITNELKDQVYLNQSKYSDFGMSFDEIPLQIIGDKSGRNDIANRFYDPSLLETCARNSGKNIRRQIEVFREQKSSTKPIVIIQGNDFDSYIRWSELMLDEIPDEMIGDIGGVAIGGAALGTGTLEDITRAFIYSQLPDELHKSNHFHTLGVGSIMRLIPNLIFIKSGLYQKNLHYSYDSTTHTSGCYNGRYYKDNKNYKFSQALIKNEWHSMHQDIEEKFNIDCTLEEFYYIMNTTSTDYLEKYGSRDKFIAVYAAFAFSAIQNFMSHIEEFLVDDNDELLKDFKKSHKIFVPMRSLKEVKTKCDFDKWQKDFGRFLNSNRIASNGNENTLESFFV